MRLDELPTSDRIEDRRRIPGGRAGLGIGTVVVLGLLAGVLGIDPRVLIGGAERMSRDGQTQEQTNAGSNGSPSDEMGHFVSAILGSTEVEWKDVFAQAGKNYNPPTLVMFSGATQSACGFAQAAMGPFYCPIDQKVYLDTSFFQDLERRFRAHLDPRALPFRLGSVFQRAAAGLGTASGERARSPRPRRVGLERGMAKGEARSVRYAPPHRSLAALRLRKLL